MSAHTPGPWNLIEYRAYHTSFIVRGGEHQNQIAQCFNWQDKGFDINSEANARLIAAAPELLEALEEFPSPVDSANAEEFRGACEKWWQIYAMPAIAKATGKESA